MKVLEQAIYSTLAGRAQLTALLATTTSIFPDLVPEDAALPAVVYFPYGPGTDARVYGAKAFEELDYVVKGIVSGFDPEAANDINEQIDLALNNTHIVVSGKTNMMGIRLGRVSFPERGDAGDYYQHRGGIYRWLIQ